jgi:PIN domain nuclease of toxin-antitoxin system
LSQESPADSFLLDTHTAIWALERPQALSPAARKAASTGPNVLSVVSYWEVMIKSMKGKLDVGDPRVWWFDALDQLAATPLLLHPRHIGTVHSLPSIHKDPFDRILIAQATVEGLTLVTMDAEIVQYSSKNLRVIR